MGDFGYSDPKSISDVFKYTSGSVLFIDSTGLIAQDNAGISFDSATDTLLVAGNLEFKSGTGFKGIFDHANSADRTYTLPNISGTLVVGGGGQGLIVNSDIAVAAGIVYSKLALTNSIVDGDIVSITTRAKLPAGIAYEDEANTFSATLTMSGANINIGGNKLLTSNLEILQAVVKRYDAGANAGGIAAAPSANGIGAFAVYPHTQTTSQIQIFSTPGELGDSDDYEVLTLFKDATMAAIDVTKGGTGTLRPLHIRMGGNEIIIVNIDNTVNDNSRTHTNFVASSPTFTGTITAVNANFSGNVVQTVAGNSSLIVKNSSDSKAISISAGTGDSYIESTGTLFLIPNVAYGSVGLGSGTSVISFASTVITSSVDISIGANKLKTTTFQVSEQSFLGAARTIFEPSSGNTAGILALLPSGTSLSAGVVIGSAAGVATDQAFLSVEHLAGGGFSINASRVTSAALEAIKLQMNSTDIITINTDNSMNFNSRAVSNLVLGSTMNANSQQIDSASKIGIGSNAYATYESAQLLLLNETNDGGSEGAVTISIAGKRSSDNQVGGIYFFNTASGDADKRLVAIRAQRLGADDVGIFRIDINNGGGLVQTLQLQEPADAETAMLIRVNRAGVFSADRVTIGVVDSGGAGFKLLRVPN